MAPGYVIAAICETAGLLALVVALVILRAERRAKSSELRSFLRSGQHALAMSGHTALNRRRGAAIRGRNLPIAPAKPKDPATRDSAARSALDRAVASR